MVLYFIPVIFIKMVSAFYYLAHYYAHFSTLTFFFSFTPFNFIFFVIFAYYCVETSPYYKFILKTSNINLYFSTSFFT